MQVNPDIIYITPEVANTALETQIAYAQYQFIVASISLFFAILIFYFAFKAAVWFIPRYWHRPKEDNK
jgi:hypothetical protein